MLDLWAKWIIYTQTSALEENRVVSVIIGRPREVQAKTRKVLKSIFKARVPIAAVNRN